LINLLDTRFLLTLLITDSMELMNLFFAAFLVIVFLIATHLIAEQLGEKRRIGYDKSFIYSFLFSPVVGLIVTLLSKKIHQ
jgi:hypothetical protein